MKFFTRFVDPFTGDSKRFEVFKNRLEKNAIKPLDISHLPPIDKNKVCKRSARSTQQTLDRTAIARADKLLAKSKSFQVGSFISYFLSCEHDINSFSYIL